MSVNLSKVAVDQLKKLVGNKNVLTRPGELVPYSYDAALDRATPSAVVIPSTLNELSLIIQFLHKNKIPFVARGAATSLCGGPIALNNGVVVALARLKKIGKLDLARREISVEPGVINLKLQQAISSESLFFPPDPGSQKACTIGGNISTNAGGPHCLKYGVTSNSIVALDIILPNGVLLKTHIEDPGFDLVGFFCGSEGTLGVVSRAILKLRVKPEFVRTMIVSFPSMETAIQSVTDIIAAGILPSSLEAMDTTIVHAIEDFMQAGYPLDAEAVLLIEVDGPSGSHLDEQVEKIKGLCEKNESETFRFAKSEEERAKLWEGRRGSYAAMARLAPNVLVEDGAVPRTKLPEALKRIKEIADENDLRMALLFHAGDGNLHPQILFDERDAAQTAIVKKAGHQMLKACVDLGGTISGEHGIGIDKRDAMKWLFTPETLSLFRRLKNVFDPLNLCNPDKLIPLVSKIIQNISPPEDVDGATVEEQLGINNPASEEELIETVRKLAAKKTKFGVLGLGTKYSFKENFSIHLANLNKVIDFDEKNLTIRVQAGAKVKDIVQLVHQSGQYLWMTGDGSIGGTIVTNSSVLPPLRDIILGMRILLPTGDVATLGAKTMKNVAGYDVAKLLIGSWGTLAIILDVTFRLFPYPADEQLTKDAKPFVFKDIHTQIKDAFDPEFILSSRTASAEPSEIEAMSKGNKSEDPEPSGPGKMDRLGDGFWS